MTHTIKTATACYTGGGIYIYYGQLENGLYFRMWDECEAAYICDSDTSAEEAEYSEFYEQHIREELTGEAFKIFWNEALSHIINGEPAFDKWNNYQKSDLEQKQIGITIIMLPFVSMHTVISTLTQTNQHRKAQPKY